MESATDAFEDAEIAREELANLIEATSTEWDASFIEDGIRIGPQADYLASALIAAGFTRQSPASTTAADAWMEGAEFVNPRVKFLRDTYNTHNPYRVAAPEGEGGNE